MPILLKCFLQDLQDIVLFSSNDHFFVKDLRIASSSNGLMVCMLITSAEIPASQCFSSYKSFPY
jgi:hypothetical protein